MLPISTNIRKITDITRKNETTYERFRVRCETTAFRFPFVLPTRYQYTISLSCFLEAVKQCICLEAIFTGVIRVALRASNIALAGDSKSKDGLRSCSMPFTRCCITYREVEKKPFFFAAHSPRTPLSY